VSFAIGGITPEASQVRRMMFDGCPARYYGIALAMNSSG
jgi:hypothetical protein